MLDRFVTKANVNLQKAIEKQDGDKKSGKKSEVVTLSPAFRWAQSLDTVYIEVKFSTRLDSPACVDVFD
jgi:hypothetical protein